MFAGQRHGLPLSDHLCDVPPGGGKTGGSAHGHRIARGWRPEAAPTPQRRRRRGWRPVHAGKADGPFDGRAPAHRARRARQPRLKYRLVAERQVAVDVIVTFVGVRRRRTLAAADRRHGGPRLVAHGPEAVTAVLVAVAVLLLAPAASVPGLARKHDDGDGSCADVGRELIPGPGMGGRSSDRDDRVSRGPEQLLPSTTRSGPPGAISKRSRACACACARTTHVPPPVSLRGLAEVTQ